MIFVLSAAASVDAWMFRRAGGVDLRMYVVYNVGRDIVDHTLEAGGDGKLEKRSVVEAEIGVSGERSHQSQHRDWRLADDTVHIYYHGGPTVYPGLLLTFFLYSPAPCALLHSS